MRAGLQNRDTRRVPDWSRVRIRDSHEESGRSRVIWDSWTLSKGFREVRGHAPRKKLEIWGLQTAGNAFKLSILPPRRQFCTISNLLRSHQADLLALGGRCVRTPRTPPAYGPASWYLSSLLRKGSLGFFKGEWRASESDEYNGGLGERKMSARGFLGRCTITLLPVFVYLKATAEERGFNLFLYRGKCWHSTRLSEFIPPVIEAYIVFLSLVWVCAPGKLTFLKKVS